MPAQFQTIQTSNQDLNRVQANISSAFNAPEASGFYSVNTQNYAVVVGTIILFIPTISISNAASGVNIALPDATQNPGFTFYFKKTDSSSNTINFSSSFKNKQNLQQTVENATIYSSSASLESGTISSDGSNWWLV